MFPGAQRMNRGNHEIASLVRACKANNVTDLVIMHETRGQPGTQNNDCYTLELELCISMRLLHDIKNKQSGIYISDYGQFRQDRIAIG